MGLKIIFWDTWEELRKINCRSHFMYLRCKFVLRDFWPAWLIASPIIFIRFKNISCANCFVLFCPLTNLWFSWGVHKLKRHDHVRDTTTTIIRIVNIYYLKCRHFSSQVLQSHRIPTSETRYIQITIQELGKVTKANARQGQSFLLQYTKRNSCTLQINKSCKQTKVVNRHVFSVAISIQQ